MRQMPLLLGRMRCVSKYCNSKCLSLLLKMKKAGLIEQK